MNSNRICRVGGIIMFVCGIGIIIFGIASTLLPIPSVISWAILVIGTINVAVGVWLLVPSGRTDPTNDPRGIE